MVRLPSGCITTCSNHTTSIVGISSASMANPFSWSDTVQIAFSSCLPCLKPSNPEASASTDSLNPTAHRIPRARPDELQGLLRDTDNDGEAETMSLHSNPGLGLQRKNRKKKPNRKGDTNPKRITLFGYNLFGNPATPPIQLPNGDDALYSAAASARTRSASTFDSDAAPLDVNAIADISSSSAMAKAAAAAEDQRLAEKEQRRQRRRERRERERIAVALASGAAAEEEFKGFQGSGGIPPTSPSRSGYPRIANAMYPQSSSGPGSSSTASQSEGYGPFVVPIPHPGAGVGFGEEDDDAADLDGGLYSRRQPRTLPGSRGDSDSRSRTSASMSDRIGAQTAYYPTDPRFAGGLQLQPPPLLQEDRNAARKKSSKSSGSKNSHTRSSNKSHSSTTSQSPSLSSPSSAAFPDIPAQVVSPSTVEQGQGFFDLEEDELVKPVVPSAARNGFPSTGFARGGGAAGGGFPSTGFTGAGLRGQQSRDMGAFLARRGDEESTGKL